MHISLHLHSTDRISQFCFSFNVSTARFWVCKQMSSEPNENQTKSNLNRQSGTIPIYMSMDKEAVGIGWKEDRGGMRLEVEERRR